MVYSILLRIVLLGMLFCVSSTISAAEFTQAKLFFKDFMSLEKRFDPKVAELYSDKAQISMTRLYPDGSQRQMSLTGSQYKPLLRSAMPLAKARGDSSRYDQIVYSQESNGVRIRMRRYSELKKYYSPYSLLVAEESKGQWRIIEEIAQMRP